MKKCCMEYFCCDQKCRCIKTKSIFLRLRKLFCYLYLIFVILFLSIVSSAANLIVKSWINDIRSNFQNIRVKHSFKSASIFRDTAMFEFSAIAANLNETAQYFRYLTSLEATNFDSSTAESQILQSYFVSLNSLSNCLMQNNDCSSLTLQASCDSSINTSIQNLFSNPGNCIDKALELDNYYKNLKTIGYYMYPNAPSFTQFTLSYYTYVSRSLLSATYDNMPNALFKSKQYVFQSASQEVDYPATYECWRSLTSQNYYTYRQCENGQTYLQCNQYGLERTDKNQCDPSHTYSFLNFNSYTTSKCQFESSRIQQIYFTRAQLLPNNNYGQNLCYIMNPILNSVATEMGICRELAFKALDYQNSNLMKAFASIGQVAQYPFILMQEGRIHNQIQVALHKQIINQNINQPSCDNNKLTNKGFTLSKLQCEESDTNCKEFYEQQSIKENINFMFEKSSHFIDIKNQKQYRDDKQALFIPTMNHYSDYYGNSTHHTLVIGIFQPKYTQKCVYQQFKESLWDIFFVLYFPFFLFVLISIFVLIIWIMNKIINRITRPISQVVISMEKLLNGTQINLNPKYFSSAAKEIQQLLTFLDQILIPMRLVDKGIDQDYNPNKKKDSNVMLLQIAKSSKMYQTSNNMNAVYICKVLNGILYARLGMYQESSNMFKASSLDISPIYSSQNKISDLKIITRSLNQAFVAFLYITNKEKKEVEEINKVKTIFYDLEQRLHQAQLLSQYLTLFKIFLEIQACEIDKAFAHLTEFHKVFIVLEEIRLSNKSLSQLSNQAKEYMRKKKMKPQLIRLVRDVKIINSIYILKQIFKTAVGKLLAKQALMWDSYNKKLLSLKYLYQSLVQSPILDPFFSRVSVNLILKILQSMKDIEISKKDKKFKHNLRRFMTKIHNRIQGRLALKFKILINIQKDQKWTSTQKYLTKQLVQRMDDDSNLTLYTFGKGLSSQKFNDLRLSIYRDNINFFLMKHKQKERLNNNFEFRQSFVLTFLNLILIERSRYYIELKQKQQLQWIFLVVSGKKLQGIDMTQYQQKFKELKPDLEMTSLCIIDTDQDNIGGESKEFNYQNNEEEIKNNPIEFFRAKHQHSFLRDVFILKSPKYQDIALLFEGGILPFHKEPFKMIGEKF